MTGDGARKGLLRICRPVAVSGTRYVYHNSKTALRSATVLTYMHELCAPRRCTYMYTYWRMKFARCVSRSIQLTRLALTLTLSLEEARPTTKPVSLPLGPGPVPHYPTSSWWQGTSTWTARAVPSQLPAPSSAEPVLATWAPTLEGSAMDRMV